MIKQSNSISMAESVEYIDKEVGANTLAFINKFTNLKVNEAKELREKLEKLNIMKLNEDHIAKVIDLLPEETEELNKIFIDVGLDEDEIKKILSTVKEFK